MKQKTPGELAFEEYLSGHGIAFEYEPPLAFTNKVIDYVVDHATHGKIYFEVEDIERSPFQGMGSFFTLDPYEPILMHIGEGQKKFKDFPEELCALVLFSQAIGVELMEPHVMLGAMYGNLGFTIPVDLDPGSADDSRIESKFLVGGGKMVLPTGYQNTRIAALISLVRYPTFAKEALRYIRTDDGRSTSGTLERCTIRTCWPKPRADPVHHGLGKRHSETPVAARLFPGANGRMVDVR